MNQVTLLGNLGADPELKTSEKGSVLKLRLATSTSWFDKDKNERLERTEWHRVTVFGKRGEALSRLLKKGSRILVRGEIRHSSYEKDNVKHYSTEIVADDVLFADGAPNGAFKSKPPPSQQPIAAPF